MALEGDFNNRQMDFSVLRELIKYDGGLTAAQVASLKTLASGELDKLEDLAALSADQITAIVALSTAELANLEILGDVGSGVAAAIAALTSAEVAVLDGPAAGVITADKVVIAGTAGAISGLGTLTLNDAANVVLDTTTGTKIGTAVGQKLGFWNATPVIQQASAAQAAVTPSTDFTGADTVDKAVVLAAVQAVETLVNRLRLDLVTTGLIKGEV